MHVPTSPSPFFVLPMNEKTPTDDQIIFFDGICGLCNKAVDFIIRHDHRRKFRYAPLQGKTALCFLPADIITGVNTLVYCRKGRLFTRSSAVIRISQDLGGLWRLMMVFLVVPPFLRDGLYDFVAGRRYKWFGKRESCRLPAQEERLLFLD
jgi:predicted DCC family thiol-disulfide oxidoreductase YuxK